MEEIFRILLKSQSQKLYFSLLIPLNTIFFFQRNKILKEYQVYLHKSNVECWTLRRRYSEVTLKTTCLINWCFHIQHTTREIRAINTTCFGFRNAFSKNGFQWFYEGQRTLSCICRLEYRLNTWILSRPGTRYWNFNAFKSMSDETPLYSMSTLALVKYT